MIKILTIMSHLYINASLKIELKRKIFMSVPLNTVIIRLSKLNCVETLTG